jgi:two-component system, OmpR family, osmolarity sensor histidine kinase EnvZ
MIGKNLLPSSLFGRALLILLLPTLLIQIVMAYVFFDRHWDNVSHHMGKALAGEAAFLVRQLENQPEGTLPPAVKDFDSITDIDIYLEPVKSFPAHPTGDDYPDFQEQLRSFIAQKFTVKKLDNVIEIRILLPKEVLRVTAPSKRLESRTTILFMLWMFGISFVFLLIAVLFLRNQIRPIRKLAKAADSFGRGIDMPDFKPSGASEVRVAARAFLVMRERIKRQLKTRTEMLAGISHDLRTPLTRMKLQLAMLSDREEARELTGDVQQMEHMIEEYLDFARGDTREDAERISVKALLEDVVEDYRRTKADVTLAAPEDVMVDLRVVGFRRMLHNLIDNAVRYGKRCKITLRLLPNSCEIVIDDEGPGIPEDKREEVFQPFRRLDPSRNVTTGGVGLGLTIARDIVLAHGGKIALATAPKGGLRVEIHVPFTRSAA